MTTKIEWTDATWNPVTGCTRVSEGCRICYIERTPPFRILGRRFVNGTTGVQFHPDRLEHPLHWRTPRRIFVNSLSDLFHEDVPDDFIKLVLAVAARTPRHTYQILTKRPKRLVQFMRGTQYGDFFGDSWARRVRRDKHARRVLEVPLSPLTMPLPNVWLGVSVEDQRTADERIPLLLQAPAAVRFVSVEPLLGPVDLSPWLARPCTMCGGSASVPAPGGGQACPRCLPVGQFQDPDQISWVIVGGESGPGARPMHPDWVRSLRDQCQAAGVPFFFKQWGEWCPDDHLTDEEVECRKGPVEQFEWPDHAQSWRTGKKRAGRILDGRTWNEFPAEGMSTRQEGDR